jgi:hypothetical protein
MPTIENDFRGSTTGHRSETRATRATWRDRIGACAAFKSHSNLVRILLIATGIQAITPDLNDLASTRALRVILQADRPSNFRQFEECYGSDHTCPVQSVPESSTRGGVEQSRALLTAEIKSCLGIARRSAARAHCLGTASMSTHSLILLFCHFKC